MREKNSDGPADRVPWSKDAEEGVIGSCLVEGVDVVAGCVQKGLLEGDFYLAANARIWKALVELYNRREEIDELTVAAELEALGALEACGGFEGLSRITDRVEVAAHWSAYCGIVMDRSLQRQALRLADRVKLSALEPAENFKILAERVQPVLTQLGELSLITDGKSLAEVAEGLLLESEAAARGEVAPETQRRWVRTPWTYFDQHFLPFDPRKDGLVIVAARPSTGKSAWARNVMGHVLRNQGMACVGFLLEMTREQWLEAMASEVAQVNLREGLHQEPEDRVRKFQGALKQFGEEADKRLFLFDADTTIEQIEARLRFLHQRVGDIGLVVIDYLQLVDTQEKKSGRMREEVVASISRRFKMLQKEFGCIFFVLSQINRESDKGEREPKLSDLRESGAIEQDADRVIFLHKPKVDHLGNAQMEGRKELEVYVIQAKNRNGPKHKARFQFRQVTTTFFEVHGSAKPSVRPQEKKEKKANQTEAFI